MATKQGSRIKCFIPGCKSVFNKDKNIKFHKFRKNILESKKEKLKWLAALPFLKEEDFSKSKYRICSRHFTEDDYIYRPTNVFKRGKDLKPNAIPTLNLPNKPKTGKRFKLQKIEIENLSTKNQDDMSLNTSRITEYELQQVKETKNIGIQCNILGPFVNADFNTFLYKNLKIVEKYIARKINEEKIPHSNITSEDELLAEINERDSFGIHMQSQQQKTCEIPNDDFFFEEILSKVKSSFPNLGFHCCEHCGLTFTDIRSYRDHEGVHAEISLLCCYCGEISDDYMKNIEHEYKCKIMKQIENGEIIPSKIRKKKKSKNSIKEEFITEEMEFYNINESIECKSDALINSNTVEPSQTGLVGYFCNICDQLFESIDLCQEHLKQHLEENSIEENETCKTSPLSNREYKISGDTTIEFLKNPIEEYSCRICFRSYGTEYLLNRHIDVKHLNPIQKSPSFQCGECNATFRNFMKLQAHVREHVVGLKHCKICNIVHDENKKYLKHLQNQQHLFLEEKWKNRYNVQLFACSLCKTKETEYNELADLAQHSDYHRISKTRTFINCLLAEYEINCLKH